MASRWPARWSRAKPKSPALPPAPPVKAIMDQVNLAFVPDVLVIPVHSTRAVPEQRRGRPPGVFVLERAQVPAAAVSRQALSTRAVRPARRGHARAATSTTTCSPTSWSPPRRSSAAPMRAASGPRANRAGRHVSRARLASAAQRTAGARARSSRSAPSATASKSACRKRLRPAPLTGRPHSWDY